MAKKYKQLESGLSVPASYGEGLIRRRPITHRNFLFTPGGGACNCVIPSCYCDDDPIVADGTVTWVSLSVDANNAVVASNNEAPCKTYYVDSVSGGGAETGSGTESDPWTNLNTIFADDCVRHLRTAYVSPDYCPMVKVLIKGTIDYLINETYITWSGYDYRLVLEPWGQDTFDITVSGGDAVTNLMRTIVKAMNVSASNTDTVYASNCSNCIFNDCNFEASVSSSLSAATYAYGANGLYSFYANCTADATNVNTTGHGNTYALGFTDGYSYYNCTAEARVSVGSARGFSSSSAPNTHLTLCNGTGRPTASITGNVTGIGFQAHNSWFHECNGTGYGGADGYAYGFYNPTYGSHYEDCIGTAYGYHSAYGFRDSASFTNCTGSATVYSGGSGTYFLAYGFGGGNSFDNCTAYADCQVSGAYYYTGIAAGFAIQPFTATFTNCTSTATSTGSGAYNSSYGYYRCGASTFDTCTGNATVTGTATCRKACGFCSNTGAAFYNCSTTPKVCVGCAECGTFACDI